MSIADGESPIATPLSLFLVQLALIVIWCKVLSFLFRYIKQPSVVAEVVTGIVLGKSVFGKIDGYMDTMFPETSLASFSIVANIGLILFMYMVGLEIDIKLMKKNFWVAMGVGLGALVVPFLFGTVSAWVLHKTVADPNVSFGTFLLFLGVALSITAFPVLARILTETKLIHTRIGGISLSAAAVEDVVAWCLLALVVAIARAKNPLDTLWTFLMLIGFSLIMFIPVRIFLNSLAKRRQAGAKMRYNVVMLLLVSIFICAWITEIIGVHAIFGAFLLGVVTPRSNRFAHSMVERIEDLVVVILLPLYFTFSGLRTDIGALNDAQSWGLVVLVITLACVGKIAGAVIASRIAKASWRESFAIGVLMNTKGLVELIVLNVGLDVGVLNTKIFTIFVLMALITTFITTPLVHLIYLRKNPMTDNVEDNQDTFSMLLVAQQIPFVPMLVHISGLFGHIRHSTFAKAIIVQEISDRPSSYFFSEFTNAVAAAPLLQKKERKAQMQAINAQAQGSGVTVETKPFASADLAKDVVSYSLEKKFQAILFAVPFSKKTALQKAPSIMIRFNQSLDIPHLTEQKGPVEKAYNFGLLHGPIENCIRNSPATIGVFLHPKKMTNVSLNRILFVYTGRSYESAALEIIKSIPGESQLKYKVITNVPNLELPPSHVIFTETPVELAFEEEKKEYDLIMLAAAREDDSAFSNELVKNTSLPVLLLYPDFRKAEGKSSVLPIEVTESKSEIHGAVDLP